jgi:protein-tyrosine-phosphatase
MKTLILAAAMMMGVATTAQEKKDRPEPLKPEQRAELRVKQMDLALDLNDKQAKDIQKLMLEKTKKAEAFKVQRKANKDAGKKLTADERFAMKSKALDERIAMKQEMKNILTADQFAKWEAMKKDRHGKITKRHKNLKKHDRR